MPPLTPPASSLELPGFLKLPGFLQLPGFQPDALFFATRVTLAMLLAYYVAFAAQVDSASSAGVCVAIVAQPSAGMTTAKAIYRIIGTLIGGCVGLALVAAFPQDRVMLLAGFALWLAVCTFVATLLRDFRSYGAALSGYTAGIITIGVIDAPQLALMTALDRVAAILIGIASVLVVNRLLSGAGAFNALVAELQDRTDAMAALAADALDGKPVGDDMAMVRIAAGVAALQTQASYTAVELPDGRLRANGARHAIAALLAMVSASRAIAATIGPDTPAELRAWLHAVADALRETAERGPGRRASGQPHSRAPLPPVPQPRCPTDALLRERAEELLASHGYALAGLRTLTDADQAMPPIRLKVARDPVAALFGALRVLISVGFGAVFCVVAGWGGATLVLIQQAAFVALLGTFPNPTQASLQFGMPLLPVALVTGVAEFLLLPDASGYVQFSLVVGSVTFLGALMQRHADWGAKAASTLTLFTIILGPTNPQSYNLAGFVGTVMQVALCVLFVTLSFNVVFRASPSRRLLRVAAGIALDLRRTLRDAARGLDKAPAQSLLYDRMSHAMDVLGRPTPSRLRVLGHIYGLGEVDLAIRRARTGLVGALAAEPGLGALVARAGQALQNQDAPAMLQAAQQLLDRQVEGPAGHPVRLAVSGLAGAARLMQPDRATLRFYRRLMA